MNISKYFLYFLIFAIINFTYAQYQDFTIGYNNPMFSPTSSEILAFSGDYNDGVFLLFPNEQLIQISAGKSSGYKYHWSPDGKYLGFKHLIEVKENEEFLQLPVMYEVKQQRYIPLSEPQKLCGIPSFSADGKIVFSVNNKIKVLDKSLNLIDEIEISHYANITPISPDGKYIAYNDESDQIWIVELETKQHKKISDNKDSYFNPIWSPDSKKIILNTITGHIKIYDLESNHLYYIDKGINPVWYNDSEHVFYHRIDVLGDGFGKPFEVVKSVVCVKNYKGGESAELTTLQEGLVGNCAVSPFGDKILYKNFTENKFYLVPLKKTKVSSLFGIISKTKFDCVLGEKRELKLQNIDRGKTIDNEVIKRFGIKIKK